jgi:hypothetical protein
LYNAKKELTPFSVPQSWKIKPIWLLPPWGKVGLGVMKKKLNFFDYPAAG